MKKIKLAVLALALVCGAVGAYGKYKKMLQIYYIAPTTSVSADYFIISPNSPAPDCIAGEFGWVCTVLAEENLPPTYAIPSQDATILTVYQ
ncbi:hypothetical protein DLD77_02795 [Chitinophaga alhagiae]|uniref:Uncharacterized protein n=1 Tax=Chitinophaga alhagiae TaxID=2203219 RepID=A0ABM6WA25_9BACT|nr:hypothetical protein [Chitinophaga alhagiae]AWO00697.1 hypothetical protein DLD77_02795 [Chitinophaga alhagiae]